MEFEFLPNLPKSDLDDRTFKDLVDECILRIPRYCPEWTNYNPSDPGITLVELFAWLTDQMLLRFNQVPRRNYVAFLELLGIRLSPPSPAQTAVTFYLTRAQTLDDPLQPIPRWTEVATERTEIDEAIVFSTIQPLSIGIPRILHFFTCDQAHEYLDDLRERQWIDSAPDLREQQRRQQQHRLHDGFANNNWLPNNQGRWSGREQSVFRAQPEEENCFYLVFAGDEPLDGNVLALAIEGEPAGPTGIDPRHPPRRWEAWDGERWHNILLKESDDGTLGFSFDEGNQAVLSAVREAQVRLHLPLHWPSVEFSNHRGRWLRCVCTAPRGAQSRYQATPLFSALSAVSLGGSVMANQCSVIRNELLGESDGKPGQRFELQTKNILQRDPLDEYVVVTLSDGTSQAWQEVNDFADSGPEDRHYTLDSITGQIQFGPLIREPSQLRNEVATRQAIQSNGLTPTERDLQALESLERQCGAVPQRGSVIRMKAYRHGGGFQGNVKQETLRKLKSAVPYVSQVVNYAPAQGGADAESLDEAVLRVPRMLRTANRAVTPEDFETLTYQASREVARVYCPRKMDYQVEPGVVRLFVVPQPRARSLPSYQFSTESSRLGSGADGETRAGATTVSLLQAPVQGAAPAEFQLTAELRETIQDFLDERRLLGIAVRLEEPRYIGVSVHVEVSLVSEYRSRSQEVQRKLLEQVYQFLNPVTGGKEGQGWPLGQVLHKSDLMALFQQFPEVLYVETLQLFVITLGENRDATADERGSDSTFAGNRRESGSSSNDLAEIPWERQPDSQDVINPGPLGTICSWAGPQGRYGHVIRFLEERSA